MELKEIIRKFREENDISQREFARRCDLSNSLISILEMGENPQTGKKMTPDLETYKKLSSAMGITVQSLFEKLGDSEYVNLFRTENVFPDGDRTLSLKEEHLIDVFRSASREAQGYAMDILEKSVAERMALKEESESQDSAS